MNEIDSPRVGVIGCGYWGRNLVRNFHELGALAAVYDLDASTREEMRRLYGVPVTESVEQMLALPDLQCVIIAAPAVQHFEIAKKALLHGKDVFVEKPLALHVEEGVELVELARKHGSPSPG